MIRATACTLATFTAVATLSACSGDVLVGDSGDAVVTATAKAGPYMSYYQPKGQLTISVKLNGGKVALSRPEKVKLVPDTTEAYSVVYQHGSLSSDEITVATDENGLLKSISSKSKDQTIEAITAINNIITQTGLLKSVLAPADKSLWSLAPSNCTAIDTSVDIEVTNFDMVSRRYSVSAVGCEAALDVDIQPKTVLYAGAALSADGPAGLTCDKVVCFRLSGAFQVTLRLVSKSRPSVALATMGPFDVIAPRRDAIGYVRFDRRAFVDRTTTATFTSGMLTGLTAKDPSEVVGVLSLPTELLKSTVLLVKL